MKRKVIILGGGDLASGTALRLHRCGLEVLITELAQPMVVRRTVAFAEAVYSGDIKVEEVCCRITNNLQEIKACWEEFVIPVVVDPDGEYVKMAFADVVVDGRMIKKKADIDVQAASLVVGLGPGFTAGENCHAVVETQRGPSLGRVYWQGSANDNTGVPETVQGYSSERVLRAPVSGFFRGKKKIGDFVDQGQIIAEVNGVEVISPFDGMVRGLIHDGITVSQGTKIGDVDPRRNPELIRFVSDKALSIGGGVMEAIFYRNSPLISNTLMEID